MFYDFINVTALAKAAGINARTLRAGIQKFRNGGGATPAVAHALQHLAAHNDWNLEGFFTCENVEMLEALRVGLRWSPADSLSWALKSFWNGTELVMCKGCGIPLVHAATLPVRDTQMNFQCEHCSLNQVL
ncbi:MAG TPA: hypothetical protein PKD70_06320 [Saprospiraceae bacterium]|nr:hypothetical protein [Saprospiraceae bacterium]HMP13473.1 hypothetical protein [Saprospiraceae bacterium]